jgi:hypothetical protein
MSLKVTLSLCFGLLLVQPAVAAGPLADSAADLAAGSVVDTVALGRWKEHELSFTYSGFTSKYSCDGLADKVRLLLRTLGARPDLKVATYGCGDLYGGPTEFPRVKLRFATLEPAADGAAALPAASAAAQPAATPQPYGLVIGREAPRLPVPGAAIAPEASALAPLPGEWRKLRFDRDQPRTLEPGDCELLEQFRDRVLPLFATRAMDDHTRCIPYQLSGTRLSLALEVFTPVPTADAARARRR